ncbi:MAG: LysR family transcriptional regulator [Burkholderiales bacterium]|nr:LysR family transcriptional regulator [Burkholderiales bacterium]
MTDRRNVLTPDALAMMDTIARTGSFAAAARELGKVPSALTYNVRQLEEALDVLLFDRRSRQAQLTAAGEELLREGRRLLCQMDAVANRVRRVALGWETQLTVAVDNAIAPRALFDLIGAFYELSPALDEGRAAGRPARAARGGRAGHPAAAAPAPGTVPTRPPVHAPPGAGADAGPPTRLKLLSEVLSGTWEAVVSGQADIAIGVPGDRLGSSPSADLQSAPLGELGFVLVVAPHHALVRAPQPLSPATLAGHRVVAVADTARSVQPVTVGVLPGQDVLTLPSMAAKLEALMRGLGCGFLPEPLVRRQVQAGRLVQLPVDQPPRVATLHYVWRQAGPQRGLALDWWLQQLERPATRRALLEQHEGLVL